MKGFFKMVFYGIKFLLADCTHTPVMCVYEPDRLCRHQSFYCSSCEYKDKDLNL